MNTYEKRAALIEELQSLVASDEMTAEQALRFEQIEKEIAEIDSQTKAVTEKRERLNSIVNAPVTKVERTAPAFLKGGRGDNEANAFKAFVTRGDKSGVSHLVDGNEVVFPIETRAAVDSTMNITTAADGGNLVPTGFSGQVAVRMNETLLAPRLGCRLIPGVGTTVNYPYESADPEVFAATSEQADNHGTSYERNTVPTGVKAFTLAKKSRKLDLTEELLADSGVNIMAYVSNRIGREIAKTHNAALVAEVVASGTSFKTFAATGAIAAGELEAILGNSTLAYYLEEGATGAWLSNPATFAAIDSITSNPRFYTNMKDGLLGYPSFKSNSVAAMGASAKSVLFGNWDYMGYRVAPEVRMIADPYSVDGIVILKYSVRVAYGVLQAGAVGYGVHAAS